MPETINLFAGRSSDGRPAYEEVLVEQRGSSKFLLVASPGLVLGVAAGDIIEVLDRGEFRILERGGNVSIQIFPEGDISALARDVEAAFTNLNGRLDGKSSRELVVTVPVDVGFQAIEQALARIVAQAPGTEWYYGNVYDDKDGVTPLNWWQPVNKT